MKLINLSPAPSALMESMRDIGYSLESAIADIIDNSITAQAADIHIRFAWNSGSPWIAVIDNGDGMSKRVLVDAMRFGSTHPGEKRKVNDLGRFGLGMKTASISQCRRLTVISKHSSSMSGCEWDLDRIKSEETDWSVGVLDEKDILCRPTFQILFKEKLKEYNTGTIVLWEGLDRIEYDGNTASQKGSQHFASIFSKTRQHLELVFHRFLSPGVGQKKINIFMNNDPLDAFNPFNETNNATKELPEQVISLDGQKIKVQPFVLPHHTKTSKEEYAKYARSEGYLHNQGFYIYRNKRLIINGTWFRLIKKDELNKLIRVRVDIPNSLDHLWKIDVKKSNAFPPANIRNELKQIIEKIEFEGRKVYHQRGHRQKTKIKDPFWTRNVKSGKVSYQINHEQPFIKHFLNNLKNDEKNEFKDILTMLQNCFPQDMFFADVASSPESICNQKDDEKMIARALDCYIDSWGGASTISKEDILELLLNEPFIHNRIISEDLLKARGLI